MNFFDEYNEKGKKNITTTRTDLIDSIGLDGTKAVIKSVLLGGNVRDITEFITQCRLFLSYASMVELFGKCISKSTNNIDDYLNIISDSLVKAKVNKKTIYLWLLGLTKKGLDNIVRTTENIDDYKAKFKESFCESIDDLNETFGELSGKIKIGETEFELNWTMMTLLMMSIGAQTLSIRGSAKSMNGKLFEKLVLGSILSILGFKYYKNPPELIDENEKIFWLSHMDEEERETDATIVFNNKAISIDIGFIGKGNPEISLDKVTRFGAYKRIGGKQHVMSTIIIVDTVAQNSDLFNKAQRVNGSVLQMKEKDWVLKFSKLVSEKLNVEDCFENINQEDLEQFLEEKLENININEFI